MTCSDKDPETGDQVRHWWKSRMGEHCKIVRHNYSAFTLHTDLTQPSQALLHDVLNLSGPAHALILPP